MNQAQRFGQQLREMGVPDDLIRKFQEQPAKREAVDLVLAICRAIEAKEKGRMENILFSDLAPVDVQALAAIRGSISMNRRLQLVFASVLDIFTKNRESEYSPRT